MDVDSVNDLLVRGEFDREGLFPHLEDLDRAPRVFEFDFGLRELPEEPAILLIRGPRQYGKSTWLEQQLRASVLKYGPGSALYLNGDEFADSDSLLRALRGALGLFRPTAPRRRLFIDEITAVTGWERALKVLADRGELRRVLVVTTGSRATDLRRGGERLPGRRGRLDRTTWLFTPVTFAEFLRVCQDDVADDAVEAYLLAGGSPLALGEIAATGRLPEWLIELVRDWVNGEFSRSGRDRSALVPVMAVLSRTGGTPVGQTRLAQEAGLANNTVAAGYLELLADLMCIGIQQAWDPSRKVPMPRTRAKYPFINLLAAVAWHPARLRTVADFRRLPEVEQGRWIEWLVAQEIWRRRALRGDPFPERLLYWQSQEHELDFVLDEWRLLEVKRGRASPREFAWFPRTHPGASLLLVNEDRFETEWLRGLTLRDLLLAPDW
ncbi:MAG: ATP-binding protein [Candidatus Riflebacteria bacterium]|nr:ATP-binding protein [Candidatus Riflebacteria bacterium]